MLSSGTRFSFFMLTVFKRYKGKVGQFSTIWIGQALSLVPMLSCKLLHQLGNFLIWKQLTASEAFIAQIVFFVPLLPDGFLIFVCGHSMLCFGEYSGACCAWSSLNDLVHAWALACTPGHLGVHAWCMGRSSPMHARDLVEICHTLQSGVCVLTNIWIFWLSFYVMACVHIWNVQYNFNVLHCIYPSTYAQHLIKIL